MSNKAETQYNPQCGERRTIFSDEYDFLTKIQICDGAGDDSKKPQTDGSRRCT